MVLYRKFDQRVVLLHLKLIRNMILSCVLKKIFATFRQQIAFQELTFLTPISKALILSKL